MGVGLSDSRRSPLPWSWFSNLRRRAEPGSNRRTARYAARYLATKGYPELGDAFDRDHARQGYAVALRKAAAGVAERSGTSVVIARMYAFAGDKDLAQQWLEKAYQDGDSTMVYLKVDPSFDILRDDPRFQALLRKMNFPP